METPLRGVFTYYGGMMRRLAIVGGVLLASCREAPSTHRDWAAMDCNFAATVHGVGRIPPEAALDSLQRMTHGYDSLLTDYDPRGPLSVLRGRKGDTIRPDPRIVEILRGALRAMSASRGTLDIGLHDIKALWALDAAHPRVPDSAAIDALLERRFGTDSVGHFVAPLEILPDGRVVLSVDSLPIDLGGVAKGWVVDRMSRSLVEWGYPTHLIQGGGEIVVHGRKASGDWKIGVKNPRATDRIVGAIGLDSGGAVSTSGDYERFFLLDGVRYHHLFDPSTGRPSHNGVASATLLCATSAQCDLWSKPMFLLGPERGSALADSLGIRVLWVRETPRGLCGATSAGWGKRLWLDSLAACPG